MKLSIGVIAALMFAAHGFAQSPGPIVAVGGGGTTEKIVARTLELAGGPEAVVVVLPQSSALEDAGDSSVKMWLDAGAKKARKVDFRDSGATAALEAASLIWIPGGDQNRFMKAIDGTGLDGEPVSFEGDGLLARCLQHETDHTLGTVFGDRLSAKSRKRLTKKHDAAAEDYPAAWPTEA